MIYLEEDKGNKRAKKCDKKKEKDGSCKMSYLSGCLQDWKITSQTSVFRFLGFYSPIKQRPIFFMVLFSESGKINDFIGKKYQKEWKNLHFDVPLF